MRNTKTLLTAAFLAVLTTASGANAAPWGHYDRPTVRHETRDMRFDMHRRIVDRDRVVTMLRMHHLRVLGEPAFVRGHYVVRIAGRFGHPMFVEINPYTGAFIGNFHI